MEERRNRNGILPALAFAACVFITVITVVTVLCGELNQDEGWYLYGAGLIHSGQAPYIDFATTQGPVMQYVYAVFWPVVEQWGVLGGRILTALFGLLAILITAVTAWRVLPGSKRMLGTLAVICLAGLNVYQLYFFSLVKTYSLAAVFIGASFLLLTFTGRRRQLYAFLSGIMIMLAAGTRMSAGAMIPVVLIYMIWQGRCGGAGKRDLRWVAYGSGAAVCMASLFVPFLIKAPEAVKFAMFEYHAGRAAAGAAYRVGFLLRLVRAYFPAVLALAAIVSCGGFRRHAAEVSGGGRGFDLMIFAGVLMVSLLHIAAPFPYDDYQAMIFPVFCLGIVLSGVQLLPDLNQGRAGGFILAMCLVFAAASPVNESMFIGKRDRIWWPVREETSLQKLGRAVDAVVKTAGGGNRLLFTQDLYLAVEAGMRVPRGMELGPFCIFPEWTREKAASCRVLNREMLLEIIAEADGGAAALSEYSLAIRAPEILPIEGRDELMEAVRERYEQVEVIGDFGQAETDLVIFSRRIK